MELGPNMSGVGLELLFNFIGALLSDFGWNAPRALATEE